MSQGERCHLNARVNAYGIALARLRHNARGTLCPPTLPLALWGPPKTFPQFFQKNVFPTILWIL